MFPSRTIRSGCLFFAFIPVVGGAVPAAEVARTAAEAAITQALDEKSPVDFKQVPLQNVVEYLEERHKIEIVLDARALNDNVLLNRDTPVTLELRHARLRTVLRMILNRLQLTHTIRHGVLLITSPDLAETKPRIAVYDVVNLVDPAEEVPGSGSPYRDDMLMKMITSLVGPTAWLESGGCGTIQAALGTLVVSQTQDVHEWISRLLATLEEGLKSEPGDVLQVEWRRSEPPVGALDKPVTLDFTDTSLDVALEHISRLIGVDMLLDVRALDDVGLTPDIPVSARAKQAPVKNAIRDMLRPLDLTWVWVDTVLVVTTPEEAEAKPIVHVYNVRDLLLPQDAGTDPIVCDCNTLIQLIYDVVEPVTWDQLGGIGTIIPCRHLLVVAQSRAGHERVEEFLERLRDGGKQGDTHRLQQILRQKTDVQFVDTPLTDVLAFLAAKHNLPLGTDHLALKDVGVNPDETLITLSVSGVSLRSVLALVLDTADLTWTVTDGQGIRITTPEHLETDLPYRLFDVSDLLANGDLSPESLLDLIRTSVAPVSWIDFGGSSCVAAFRGKLVVSQIPQVQDEIEKLLDKLRAARDARATSQAEE